MSRVSFYEIRGQSPEFVLARLLERTLESGKRALVVAGSEERAEVVIDHLWAYDPESWLPHGGTRDGEAGEQPVWIGTDDHAPNQASYLFLLDGVSSDRLEAFERCFDLFDGESETAKAMARDRWRAAKAAGHDLEFWRRNAGGGWERVA